MVREKEISVYEYFNEGVDAILKEFWICEEELRKLKAADQVWADQEEKLEETYEEKVVTVQKEMRQREEEGNKRIADYRNKREAVAAKIQEKQMRIKFLNTEELPLKAGRLDKSQEENWYQNYQELLLSYKEGDDEARKQNLLFQPLEPVLAQKQEILFRQADSERNIAVKREEMEVNASLKALEQIREIFTETEQENMLTALNEALEHLEHPGDPEEAARKYAQAKLQIKIGGIPLNILKPIGRGIFCFPMVLVRMFFEKGRLPKGLEKVAHAFHLPRNNQESDPQKVQKINWVLDGISILLNLVLICVLTADSLGIWLAFMALLPNVMPIGFLVGAGRGFWKDRKITSAVFGGLAGIILSLLLCILLFVYPVFMMWMLGNIGIFCLWLAASVVLYGVEDIYQLVKHQEIEKDYVRLMEEGKVQHAAELTHCGELVSAYKAALPQAVESEKESIKEMEQELRQNGQELKTVRQELEKKEAGLWEIYKDLTIEEAQLDWQKSCRDLEELQKEVGFMEAEVRQIENALDKEEQTLADERRKRNQELGSLKEKKEREWKTARQAWEDDTKKTKKRYESHLDFLCKQMRKDGLRDLTRNKENGAKGFDYRKAWTRMYYLATSVVGMMPYIAWYQEELQAGQEVLSDMIAEAAGIPSEYANMVPSRLITGIQHCPIAPEMQEAVERVMVDWQNEIRRADGDATEEQREDYAIKSSLPVDGFYKLCLNQVDRSWQEGDLYPTIFVYDFGNLDENDEKRQDLRDFALQTLCAPLLQCWKIDSSKFHIDVMLTDHRDDFEKSKAWTKLYGEAGRIYQGSDIAKELERIYQTGRRTRELVGNEGYFAKVKATAQNGESFEEFVRIVIFTNMNYGVLSGMKDEINNVLDITKPDGGRSRSGICPYFFMDLNHLQEGKRSAQVCLDLVKNFRGNIYKLTEKENAGEFETAFYDWKVVEKESLQEVLSKLAD